MALEISPDGTVLVAATRKRLYFLPLADLESGWVIVEPETQLSCLAIHPTDHFVATGDVKGKIHFYYCLDSAWWKERAEKQREQGSSLAANGPSPSVTLHWHAHPVGALNFAANGSSLISGGEEAVLVNWQLRSGNKKNFLPRLGAPVVGLSVTLTTAERGQEIAVTLRDGTILFIPNQSMAIKRSIAGIKWGMHDVCFVQSRR